MSEIAPRWAAGRWDSPAALAWIRRVIPRVMAKVTKNPISIQIAGARPVSTKTRWYQPTPQPYPPDFRCYRGTGGILSSPHPHNAGRNRLRYSVLALISPAPR
jgi:hypothetical protein